MDIGDISTKDILCALGFDLQKGIPQRGAYPTYLALYKCNLGKNNVPDLFNFSIEQDFPRGINIEIPEGTVKEIFANSERYHKKLLSLMMEFIHARCATSEEYPDELTFTCFSVLHELGHLEYFLDRNLSIEDYVREDKEKRNANAMMEAGERDKFLDYRNIPSEKAADEFAFRLLIDLMNELMNEE